MNIPFFSLQRQWNNRKEKIKPAIDKVLESQYYIGGPTVQNFEKNFASRVGAQFAVSCNSGTDALWLALKALRLQKNEIVLTTPFSFIASSSEIAAHGGIPVFIDVDPDTYLMSPDLTQKWLEQNTHTTEGTTIHTKTGFKVAGILAVNIFGQCADFTALNALAKKHAFWTVEDAAQSIGARHNGKESGNLATISTFSFYPTKNMSAFGDAGMTTTSDPELAQRLTQLKNHGRMSHYEYRELGINSRLDALQAAILDVKLTYIDELNSRRAQIAEMYNAAFTHVSTLTLTKTVNENNTYHQYCVTMDASLRDEFIKHLEDNGVGARVYYPETLSSFTFFNQHKDLSNTCPVAEKLTQTIVSLPIWPELTNEEIEQVIKVVQSFAAVQSEKNMSQQLNG